MKAWRRTSRQQSTGAAAAAPVILSVSATTPDADYLVTFSSAVTWDGIGAGSMTTGGFPATWSLQVSPTQISIATTNAPIVGEPWTHGMLDPSLSPSPTAAEFGFTIA